MNKQRKNTPAKGSTASLALAAGSALLSFFKQVRYFIGGIPYQWDICGRAARMPKTTYPDLSSMVREARCDLERLSREQSDAGVTAHLESSTDRAQNR